MTYEMEMNVQYHKGRDEGLSEGIEQGRAEGLEQGKKDTALKMLELSLPLEQISQITGLSEEEILALKTAEVKV